MYKGKEGMFSYYLHRITGVGVFIFLLAHIVDTMFIGWGPEAYNAMVKIYTHPVARIGEVLLAGALVYHALNGVRIILIDFWSSGVKYQRQMFYVGAVIYVLMILPIAYLMLSPLMAR